MTSYSPDASAQAVSTLTYGQTATTSTPTTLALTTQSSINFAGVAKRNTVDYYLSFNPSAIAQHSTFTIAATSPTAGDAIQITTTDGSSIPKTRVLAYTVQAGDSLADVVELVVALINTSPYLYASTDSTSTPYTINVKSVIPGQAHTVAVTETGTSLTISATTVVVPASGVANYGKIFTANLNAGVSTDADGYFQLSVDLQSFDGAQPIAASSSGIVALASQKHALTFKALRAARGV